MKKVSIITFHASHNYGSALQAYALQSVIKDLCRNCEIVNLRTDRQVDLYTVFTKRKGIKYLFKNAAHLMYYIPLHKKYLNFESFINQKLNITKQTFRSLEEIESANLNYDYYICGSDQIWNPVPADFDWSYYLPFVKSGKKISYAPSFGQLAATGDSGVADKIAKYLSTFDNISVREERSQENVYRLIGQKPQIVLDPTLLLKSVDWDKLSQKKLVKDDYIFLYTLFADKDILKIASILSKKLNMPIVTSNLSNQYDVITPYKKHFYSGPLEFISFIKHSKFVLTSSFHGTAFSVIYNTPFFAIKGNEDARISTLLNITGLNERAVDLNNIDEKCKSAFSINFTFANRAIEDERKKSLDYLKNALDIEE